MSGDHNMNCSANEALEKMAANSRELGLDYESNSHYKLFQMPQYVGGYRLGGPTYYTQFMLVRKPNWLHRTVVKLLLGWEWVDA